MKSELKKKVDSLIISIRATREHLNYTQEYLAMKLNVSQNAYSKLELGYSKLTILRLFQICEILEINITELFETEKPKVTYRLIYNPALPRSAVESFVLG